MTVIFTKINSLDEFDYDSMFKSSYPTIDGNFLWPPHITLYDEKKQYYKYQLLSALDGTWLRKSDTETLFMYTGIYDDIMMEFAAGFVDENNILRVHWYLTAPDANGSKNAIHLESTDVIRNAFYTSHNIASYKVPTFNTSDFYRWIKLRQSSGILKVIDEQPTFPGMDGFEQYVTFIIAV